jgi:hypothetical protein
MKINHFNYLHWFYLLTATCFDADCSGCAVWGMKCLRPLEYWDQGFESHTRHGCLSAFILCLCCPV